MKCQHFKAETPESTPIPATVQISKASAFLMHSAAARIDRLEAGAELIATPVRQRERAWASAVKTATKIKMLLPTSIWGYPNLYSRCPAEIDHRTVWIVHIFWGQKHPCQTVSWTWSSMRCDVASSGNGPAFAVLPLHRSPCGVWVTG